MVRYILLTSVFFQVSLTAFTQVNPHYSEPVDFFAEGLLLHTVESELPISPRLYHELSSENEKVIAENLTDYSYRTSIDNDHLVNVSDRAIVLDIVKQSIRAKDYATAQNLIESISYSDLDKEIQDDFQFFRGYLHFVHKDFEMASKIFDESLSLKSNYEYATFYYSAFCDMFSENYVQSQEKFQKLHGKRPYDQDLPYYLSLLAYKQENYKDVISILSRVNTEGSMYSDAITNLLSRAYYKESKWEKLSDVLLSSKDCCESNEQHYFVGLSLYKQQKYDACIPHLTKATELGTVEAQNAMLALGHLYARKNKVLAPPFFEEAAQLTFDEGLRDQAIIALANHYEGINNIPKANQYLNRISETSNYYEETLKTKLRIAYDYEDYSKALDIVLQLQPSEKYDKLYHDLLVKNGIHSIQNGSRETGLKYLTEASQLDHNLIAQKEAYSYLIKSYFSNQQYEKVIALKDVLSDQSIQDPTVILETNYLKAYSHFYLKDYPKSITAFGKCEQLLADAYRLDAKDEYEAKYEDILLRRADGHFLLGQKEDAVQYYTKAYEHSADHGDYALYQKGKIEDLKGEHYLQIDTYEILEKKYPNSKYVIDTYLKRGDVYLQLSKDAQAYDQYAKVYQAATANADDRFHALMRMGLINYNQGDELNALVYYKKIFENGLLPDNKGQEALLVIEEIYLNNLQDADGYYSFLESIGSSKSNSINKDSLEYHIAQEVLLTDKEHGLDKLNKYINAYPNGRYSIYALKEIAKIHESNDSHDEAISSYKALLEKDQSARPLGIQRIIYNLGQKGDAHKEYIYYNKLLIAENISNEHNEKAYTRIAKATTYIESPSVYEKEIQTAISNNSLTDAEKDLILMHLAKDYLKKNEYGRATNHLKSMAKSKDSNVAAEALYLVAKRLVHIDKDNEAISLIERITALSDVNRNHIARSLVLRSRIHLKADEIELAQIIIESVLEQQDLDPSILKSADKIVNEIKAKSKAQLNKDNPTVQLQYGTYE